MISLARSNFHFALHYLQVLRKFRQVGQAIQIHQYLNAQLQVHIHAKMVNVNLPVMSGYLVRMGRSSAHKETVFQVKLNVH